MMGRWIEITFVLIVLYLVLSRAKGFSAAMGSIAKAYTGAVRALQGR
jgi:hypothetical protein